MKVDIGPTSLTCFGMMAELPALSCCRGDALVDKGAEAPKSCLSLVEMRTQAATGGLLPAGTAFTAMKTIVSRPFPFGPSVKRPREEPVGQTTSLPSPAEGGLFKQNQEKL